MKFSSNDEKYKVNLYTSALKFDNIKLVKNRGDPMIDTNKKFVFDMDELKFAEFPLDELFSLQVNYNNVKYEFLIRFSSSNKNLICMGSGAYSPKEKISLPIFRRHSWQSEFEESVIYYNDPTLYQYDPNILLGWGVGKNDEWYLLVITDIIRILAIKNDIEPKNILFFGSSGGGFTATILSTFIKNSSVIVNNPQMFLIKYVKAIFDKMISSCFDNLDLETILTQYGYRFDVVKLFKREKYMPKITYIVNIDSEIDISNQFIPFINSLASFEHFNDRINVLLYKDKRGHGGIFSTQETIKMIKNHFNRNEESTIRNQNYLLKKELKAKENSIISTRENYEKLNNQFEILERDLIDTKKQLEIIANTKPYRIAYFLHRCSHELLKGDMNNKKDFLRWIFCKLIKKESGLEFKYNPLMKLVK